MLRIGLTGGIGSGKSSVARVWARAGAHVVSADDLARRAVERGTPGLREVVDAFGPDVLSADGTLDRARVRERVFSDAAARERLESILHPEIARLRAAEEARLEAAGAALVVLEIPLLFEAGLDDEMDVIVVVDAPLERRIERVAATRGIEPAEARRMAESQMDPAAKRARADIVIDNTGSLAELEARAEEAWSELQRRARASA